MNEALAKAWDEGVARASGWRSGGDPSPVLEALALALVLDVTGDLGGVAEAQRKSLCATGRRALLELGGGQRRARGADAQADWRWAAELARAGLALLSREARVEASAVGRVHPPATRIVRMLSAAPDALTAASTAAHLRGCARCSADLRVLAMATGDDDRSARGVAPVAMVAAAADAAQVRSPDDGRTVARLDDPAAQAVVFDRETPRRLAIYADASLPVRYVGEGVTTEDVLRGYWLGIVADGVEHIDGTLHVAERAIAWRVELADPVS